MINIILEVNPAKIRNNAVSLIDNIIVEKINDNLLMQYSS